LKHAPIPNMLVGHRSTGGAKFPATRPNLAGCYHRRYHRCVSCWFFLVILIVVRTLEYVSENLDSPVVANALNWIRKSSNSGLPVGAPSDEAGDFRGSPEMILHEIDNRSLTVLSKRSQTLRRYLWSGYPILDCEVIEQSLTRWNQRLVGRNVASTGMKPEESLASHRLPVVSN